MESIAPETEQQVSPSVFAEGGDARAIVDCAEDYRYRPVCTTSKDQVCQISNGLPYCNRLLFDIGLELREQRGGSLSLVTIDVNLEPLPGPESCRATPSFVGYCKTTSASPPSISGIAHRQATRTTRGIPEEQRFPPEGLTVSGEDVDREKLLLDKVLVRNDSLSTLKILNVFGGGRSVRFITKILAECSSLKKLYVGSARTTCTKISQATLTRCVDALAHNQILEELTLPYSLWHPNNWISFFEMLPRNKHLKKFDVTHRFPQDYRTLPPVLEALASTKQSANVSFPDIMYMV
ncbi:hypothetical protein MRX96_050748 [Rhipicephalus microplus]